MKFKKKYLFFSIVGILIVLVLGICGYEYHKIHSTANTISTNHSAASRQQLKQGKPFSILILGTDVGALGRGTSYAGNTDTLELITVNPKKQTLTTTAIPRDTLVRVENKNKVEYTKINAAYALGGPKEIKKQVHELLDVPIDYYALVNMGGLEKTVDAVGGVTVNNPFAFKYERHTYPKGKQYLNGQEALGYSRMRYDDPDNDYGRQKRGQQVLLSALTKVNKSKNIMQMNSLLDTAKDNVRTDLPLDDLMTLYRNYHGALAHTQSDHLQGKNATIDNFSFQIAPNREMQRLSDSTRQALGLTKVKVNNIQTKMNGMQTNWNGYNNVDYILPDNAQVYIPVNKV